MELAKSVALLLFISSLVESASDVQLQDSVTKRQVTDPRHIFRMEGDDDDFRNSLKMEGDDDSFQREDDTDYRNTFRMEDDDYRNTLRMENDDYRNMEDDYKRMEDDDYKQIEGDDDFVLVQDDDYKMEQNGDYNQDTNRENVLRKTYAMGDDDFVIEQDDDYKIEDGSDDYQRNAKKADFLLRELASLQTGTHTKPPQKLNLETQAHSTAPGQRKRALFEENTDMDALVQRIMSEESSDDDDDGDDKAMSQMVMVSAEGYEYTLNENGKQFDQAEIMKFSDSSDSAYSASEGMSRVEAVINASSQRIIGRDTRVRIRNTYYYPWSAMGRIDSGCTGTFIGPRHVLTAGHCVFNPYTRKWNRNLNVRRCKSCNPRNGYLYRWKYAVTVRGWIHGRRSYDYAVIVVRRPSCSWMSFGYRIPMPKYNVHIAGYPIDKKGLCLWYSYCRLRRIFSRMMSYNCDTYYGMSGASVYAKFRYSRIVYGVHIGSGRGRNVAIRINKQRFRTLLYIRRKFK